MELKPGYKQTEVGVIPEEWEVVTASEACSLVVDCKNRTPPIVDASEYAVVRTPNVRDGQFIQEDLRFTDESSYREWTARAVPQAGDIMITREAPLGEVCAVPEIHKVCLGQRMMLYRPSPSKTDSRYLLYSLMSLPVRANLMRKIGGSTVGHAKVDDIRFLKLPLPPLSEQRTIATLLSDTDALLASLKQLIAKKRDIKQAAMQELLTGNRRLPGFEVEWKEASIGGMIDLLTGFPFPSSGYRSSGIRLLRGSNVKRGLINWNEDLAEHWPAISSDIARYELCEGDIVIAMDGALVGRSYARVQPSDLPALLLQRVARIRSSSLCNDFLFFQIGSSRFADHCDSVKTSTAIPHISPADIRNFRTFIPPTKKEQNAIAAILLDLDAELSGLEAHLDKARDLKQGMMQQLLTGKIRLT